MNKTNKYTAITGASSGIGYAVAKEFAKHGKNLIIIARREDRLEKLKSEILEVYPSLDIIIKVCDLSIIQNVYKLYEELKVYDIETWINNAGFGNYSSVSNQDLNKIETMMRLNIEALTILSSLYVRDYKNIVGAQLINVSSRGGYIIVPNAITYCAGKFYVSVFTEGLAHELKAESAKLQAKVLAPSATETEFGLVANDITEYDYDEKFSKYHTSEQMAEFLLQLYNSDKTVGLVDWESYEFKMQNPLFDYVGVSANNQKL